jgi:hypothetical protein
MTGNPPSIAELLRSAVGLGNQLLDAGEAAVLEEHAEYCRKVAGEIWSFVCELRTSIPASDVERAELNELCAALESRLDAS